MKENITRTLWGDYGYTEKSMPYSYTGRNE